MATAVEELASAIFKVAMGYDPEMQMVKQLDEIDKDLAIFEIGNLRFFVAAYASQKYLRDERARKQAREVHSKMLHQQLRVTDEWRLRKNPNLMIDELNRRVVLYWEALSLPNNLPPWNVGRVFCQLCTNEKEVGPNYHITMVGSLEFTACLGAVHNFLKEQKKTDAENLIDI